MSLDLADINHASEDRFIELLGGIFEHSPWVAELVINERPFTSVAQMHNAMTAAMRRAPEMQRMELLCRHPELAGKEASAGELTDESAREQAGAGLNRCTADELELIQSLNRTYRARFGFPFIIAVSGLDKHQIIAAMQSRLDNSDVDEFATALGEVEKIARIRLDALIDA